MLSQGLLDIEVRNMDDVMMLFNEGEKNRTVASTKMNTNRYIYFIVKQDCIHTYVLCNDIRATPQHWLMLTSGQTPNQ